MNAAPYRDRLEFFKLGMAAVEAGQQFACSPSLVSYETARRAQELWLVLADRFPDDERFAEGARLCRQWLKTVEDFPRDYARSSRVN